MRTKLAGIPMIVYPIVGYRCDTEDSTFCRLARCSPQACRLSRNTTRSCSRCAPPQDSPHASFPPTTSATKPQCHHRLTIHAVAPYPNGLDADVFRQQSHGSAKLVTSTVFPRCTPGATFSSCWHPHCKDGHDANIRLDCYCANRRHLGVQICIQ
jgi:hypothetical protein